MDFLGATRDEILFVAFLILLVLVAPKVPKLGERVGALFASPGRKSAAPKPGDRPGNEG